ncbi:Zn-dependent oxidoreductase, NADPH:quinone reductase [Thiovulum sp. ES]|nr:Zn-dependent oxidoreductase, NADPH:quinone reductase [Thiovulum sp. ES]
MKAVYIEGFEDADVLKFGSLPEPKIGPGEVLVRVKAVSLNHLDVWVRRGVYPKLKMPHVLGSDVAGIVEEVGEGVDLEVGKKALVSPGISCGKCEMCLSGKDNLCKDYRILGEHVWGGYAEFVKVPAQNILPFPEGLSFEEASSIPLVFLTAWQAVVEKGEVKAGDMVFITSAGGGVGSAAVQIAKLFNAFVIATVGSDEKVERAYDLGADFVISRKKEDFERVVLEKFGRVDLVVDHSGKENLQKLINITKWGGKVVIYGATSGYDAQIDLRHIFYRQVSLIGSTMGSKGSLFRVIRLVEQKKLRPVVYKVLELKDAREGHRILESFSPFGKVVLAV